MRPNAIDGSFDPHPLSSFKQFFHVRFRLRTLIGLVVFVGVVFAVIARDHRFHQEYSAFERKMLDETCFDIADFEAACVLPDWLSRLLPEQTRRDYTHITYLDLTFNELSGFTAVELNEELPKHYVEQIRIYNPTLSGEMRDVLLGFPRLKRIMVLELNRPVESHECDLRTDALSGIHVVFE
ncbi:MAG: hypothetical protein AAFU85_08485 [Planctomycetota bacterium]